MSSYLGDLWSSTKANLTAAPVIAGTAAGVITTRAFVCEKSWADMLSVDTIMAWAMMHGTFSLANAAYSLQAGGS